MKEFFYNIKCVWKYSKDEKMKIVIYFILSIFGVIASIIYPIILMKNFTKQKKLCTCHLNTNNIS